MRADEVTGTPRAPSTADVLRQAGLAVSEGDFARLLAEALEGLRPGAARTPDPRHALTPGDAEALTAAGADLSPLGADEDDPLAATAAEYAALLATARTVPEAARDLGIDASRVRHRLAERSLLGVRLRRGWRLPAFQFDGEGGALPGLDRVLPHLPADLHPVAAWRFFATPVPELEVAGAARAPIDWLGAGGDPSAVATLAADL